MQCKPTSSGKIDRPREECSGRLPVSSGANTEILLRWRGLHHILLKSPGPGDWVSVDFSPSQLPHIMASATEIQADDESWLQQTRFIPPDAIFALTAQYLADSDPRKVNLGQGTYRDSQGQPWVLPSVNKAREALLTQGLNHEYLPILGLASFRDATAKLVLGSDVFGARKDKV